MQVMKKQQRRMMLVTSKQLRNAMMTGTKENGMLMGMM